MFSTFLVTTTPATTAMMTPWQHINNVYDDSQQHFKQHFDRICVSSLVRPPFSFWFY
jgi:hypothetical protein